MAWKFVSEQTSEVRFVPKRTMKLCVLHKHTLDGHCFIAFVCVCVGYWRAISFSPFLAFIAFRACSGESFEGGGGGKANLQTSDYGGRMQTKANSDLT